MRTSCRGGAAIWLLLLSACASPVEGLWPAPPEFAVHTIYVSLDTWHAMIALPIQQGDRDQPLAFSFKEGTSPPALIAQYSGRV